MTAAKDVDKTAGKTANKAADKAPAPAPVPVPVRTNRAVKTTTPARKTAQAGTTPAAATLHTVGILGLGIMGSAMAGNLMKAGFTVCGYDPSAAARKAFKAAGGTLCADAAALAHQAQQAQAVITSLPSAAALIASAHALASTARKGLLVVETSTLDTADKEAARRILAAAGVVLLDCPLSGTGAQAARKDLTVYASGPKAAIRQLQPVFDGFSRSQFNLGAFGNGMRMKLMANLLVAIHNVSTAEALLLGKRWGIKPADAARVLADGAGGSRMLQVRGPMMDGAGWETATMKIEVWQKDMKLIAAALREAGVPAPLFSATVPIYDAAMGMGHAQHDTAAVFDVLDRMSTPPARASVRPSVPARAPRSAKRAKPQ